MTDIAHDLSATHGVNNDEQSSNGDESTVGKAEGGRSQPKDAPHKNKE
jgi:hypothetical protein